MLLLDVINFFFYQQNTKNDCNPFFYYSYLDINYICYITFELIVLENELEVLIPAAFIS